MISLIEYLQEQFQSMLDELNGRPQALEEKVDKDSHNSNKPP